MYVMYNVFVNNGLINMFLNKGCIIIKSLEITFVICYNDIMLVQKLELSDK